MKVRAALWLYGAVCYLATVAIFVYTAGWLTNAFFPVTIDSGPAQPVVRGLAIDVALLVVFCALHSILARTRVKRLMRRAVPHLLERSTYCLVFSVLLFGLYFSWQSVPDPIWQVESRAGVVAMHGLFALAWALHLLGIGMVGHNEFFGLRQIGFAMRGEAYRPLPPMSPRYYALAHVPLVGGLMLVPWMTPTMSLGHLVFAIVTSGYCVVGSYFSHRDTGGVLEHGEQRPALLEVGGVEPLREPRVDRS